MFKKFLDKAKDKTKDIIDTIAADVNINEENPETDPSKLWAISLSAPIANSAWQYINSIETGMDKESLIDGIGDAWNINSKESANGTIQWLAAGGHRIYYPFSLYIYENLKQVEWQEATISHLNEQTMDDDSKQDAFNRIMSILNNLKDTLPTLKQEHDIDAAALQRGILAWDAARSVILARQCFDAGLISEDDAWQAILEVVLPVKEAYSSWKEYWQGFILGRTLWSGLNSSYEDMSDEGKTLFKSDSSPFNTIVW